MSIAQQDSQGRWMRPEQAADYLGLTRATLAKMRCTGGGPPFRKMGRLVSYDRADLDAWLAARPVHTSTSAATVAAQGQAA